MKIKKDQSPKPVKYIASVAKAILVLCGLLLITHQPQSKTKSTPDIDPKIEFLSPAKQLYNNLAFPSLNYEAFSKALIGFNYYQSNNQLNNDTLLTLVDFSKPSKEKRFYVIDVKNQNVVIETYVAHGKNTGLYSATKFSNIPQSLQSSLGFYITSNTYRGKHGYSLQIDGMEKGINHKARQRAIVIHGAKYVSEAFIERNGRLGRSFGCPALSYDISTTVIDLIKNKTCLFIFHPSESYANQSKILNTTTI